MSGIGAEVEVAELDVARRTGGGLRDGDPGDQCGEGARERDRARSALDGGTMGGLGVVGLSSPDFTSARFQRGLPRLLFE